ncbi:hypothetical protein B0H19DRAFT_1214557 [Mycena capillaripes]|nr:hypothetical protein B0H19DRAFT_1214557 [Mycena capillaripes]
MSHLEHADDIAILSYTPAGLQRHLDSFGHWYGNNLLEANAAKSWIRVFGCIPAEIPRFTLNGGPVRYTDQFCYVEITFQPQQRAAPGILYWEFGDLPPTEGRLFYLPCIDPHLVHAADAIVDVDNKSLPLLEKVQRAFLRRLLGVGQYSMRTPLFTELGLVPLHYQRLIIALRYLKYLIGLKRTHYAGVALGDSYQLFMSGKQGYWMDLVYAFGKLRFPVIPPVLPDLTAEKCDALGNTVYSAAMRNLQEDVNKSTRLYLLHNRLEPLENDTPRAITVVLRHYLQMVVNSAHRRALTRMLLNQNSLAVERLRYKRRFGCADVETVEHALFFCNKSELLLTREAGSVCHQYLRSSARYTVRYGTHGNDGFKSSRV